MIFFPVRVAQCLKDVHLITDFMFNFFVKYSQYNMIYE